MIAKVHLLCWGVVLGSYHDVININQICSKVFQAKTSKIWTLKNTLIIISSRRDPKETSTKASPMSKRNHPSMLILPSCLSYVQIRFPDKAGRASKMKLKSSSCSSHWEWDLMIQLLRICEFLVACNAWNHYIKNSSETTRKSKIFSPKGWLTIGWPGNPAEIFKKKFPALGEMTIFDK